MSITSILGPDGAIARRLSSYEARPQQLEMAEAVADAIANRRHLMVEAGTGVGKSFAYLTPAIQARHDPDIQVLVVRPTCYSASGRIRVPAVQGVEGGGAGTDPIDAW